jgi:Tfp pilus assembly protein PilE
MSYCSKCGKEVSEGGLYCQHCGGNLSTTTSPSFQTAKVSSGLSMEDYAVFVGKNSEKYLTKFTNFNSGGIDSFKATWHWPALFVPFWWLLYRKMYGWAALAFLIGIIPYLGLLSGFVWAILANYIYYTHARKKILEIKQLHPAPETQKVVIAVTGGVGNAALMIGAAIALVAVIAILAAIAIPQFALYRTRANDAAALSDLSNARASCEAYYNANQRYPQTLAETGFNSTNNVQVTYAQSDSKSYIIVAKHNQGGKLYKTTSDSADVFVSNANDTGGHFTPLR